VDKIVLVHLSDIHFTGSSGNVHDVDQNVRDELLRDVAELTKQLGSATGVLVTGDIAFSGKKEEYQHAGDWLRKVCDAVGCEEQKVAVVPGNHDVDRGLAGDLITKMLHQSIRGLDGPAIDSKLREFFSNAGSANALLAPLAAYNTQRERITFALIAQTESISAAELAEELELPDAGALRPWLGRLLTWGLVDQSGRTNATRYFVRPALLRDAGLDALTTLTRVQPHRLRALILEDLERFPDSSKSDVWRRVGPEIPERTFRRALEELVESGDVVTAGEKRWRRYRLKGSIGHDGNDGR